MVHQFFQLHYAIFDIYEDVSLDDGSYLHFSFRTSWEAFVSLHLFFELGLSSLIRWPWPILEFWFNPGIVFYQRRCFTWRQLLIPSIGTTSFVLWFRKWWQSEPRVKSASNSVSFPKDWVSKELVFYSCNILILVRISIDDHFVNYFIIGSYHPCFTWESRQSREKLFFFAKPTRGYLVHRVHFSRPHFNRYAHSVLDAFVTLFWS